MTTHYETLGVRPDATAKEIRSAYRKIALAHHPDRSSSPHSKSVFIAATEAYDVLGDEFERAEYDRMLGRRAESNARKAEEERLERLRQTERRRTPAAPAPEPAKPRSAGFDAAGTAKGMKTAFSLGRLDEADRLAEALLAKFPRTAEAHALRGDVARAKGRPTEALRHYALAVQHDPRNLAYARRYEEIVTRTSVVTRGKRVAVTEVRGHPAWPALGGLAAIAALAAGGLIHEPPVVRELGAISTWNVPMVVAMTVAGLLTGVGMSLGGLLDRFHGTGGGLSVAVLLGAVAFVNYWAAAGLFAMLGLLSGFAAGPSRLFAATGAMTMLAMVAGLMNPALDPLQILLWGGNVVYVAAVAGWLFADALRS